MRVLVSPLDWGLGHATRCVPLIRALRAAGHEPVICASGPGSRLLRSEFPGLPQYSLPSYSMRYTRHKALLPFWLALQLPFFFLSMFRDRAQAERLAREQNAGLIIADGRYGFRARGIPCVFISHQLEILPPGPAWLQKSLRAPIAWLNRRALRRFQETWVPDFPGRLNLSGALGHPGKPWPRVEYILPLCRFRPEALPWDRALEPSGPEALDAIEVLALVSGPEPQRTLFEEALIRQLEKLPGTRVLVRGKPGTGRAAGAGSIRAGELNVFDHLAEKDLLACLARARGVACRSGYTTMMELAGLGQGHVLLVPTPGQPEQEYLADHAFRSGFAARQDQEALDVEAGLRAAESLPGFSAALRKPASSGAPAFNLADWISRHPLLSVS